MEIIAFSVWLKKIECEREREKRCSRNSGTGRTSCPARPSDRRYEEKSPLKWGVGLYSLITANLEHGFRVIHTPDAESHTHSLSLSPLWVFFSFSFHNGFRIFLRYLAGDALQFNEYPAD
ncbi:hypothetical protein CEXT_32401 [Caerostris extrusa]|uniref:Uncharacterized protein n=1 Tax=Caerostris extrusa TaxID=172846 RepID=A0AAV4RRW1_CAEEX|nr:hypothetical protein CEXT_32401 [Caerostris extrusa]